MTNILNNLIALKQNKFDIAIIGCNGLVGRTLLDLLTLYRFPSTQIHLYSTSNLTENIISNQKSFFVKNIDEDIENPPYSVAFMCADNAVSQKYSKLLTSKGLTVIDNSSYYRLHTDIPLVLPEINFNSIKPTDKLICNPNCVTAIYLSALFPLIKAYNPTKIVLTALQSLSGAGNKSLNDFICNNSIYCNTNYPLIDSILDNGSSKEEEKITYETRKILAKNPDQLEVYATSIRTPVTNCHSISVYMETEKTIDPSIIDELYEAYPYCNLIHSDIQKLLSNHLKNRLTLSIGRLRTSKNSLNAYIIGDNLYKGASLNALQIFNELCLQNKLS